MNSEPTLLRLFNALVERNLIRTSRLRPIGTAVKQYAGMLGYSDPLQCPYDAYFKSDKERNRIMDEKAPQGMGHNAVRNLKNNISFILRKGLEVGIISSNPEPLGCQEGANKLIRAIRNEHVQPTKY